MRRCVVDNSIARVVMDGFKFPLGVYPIEPMHPRAGYTVDFESADGDEDEGEWEEWPDRYVYEIVIGAERLEALCRQLFWLMPGRAYPILDVLGQDAFRDIDPYISYDLIGLDRFDDALRRFAPFFFEDGLCGFGLLAHEPNFYYVFVDEHKRITVRVAAEFRERVDRLLEAFELEAIAEPAAADAASHEHRGVLAVEDGNADLLSGEEVVWQLREAWSLTLNIDPESNVDQDHESLGRTGWHFVVRTGTDGANGSGVGPISGRRGRLAEALLIADSLRAAEELAAEAVAALSAVEGEGCEPWVVVLASDRLTWAKLAEECAAWGGPPLAAPEKVKEDRILAARWVE